MEASEALAEAGRAVGEWLEGMAAAASALAPAGSARMHYPLSVARMLGREATGWAGLRKRLYALRLDLALRDGMADAWKELEDFKKNSLATGKVSSGDLFGTREFLKNNYLYRFTAAEFGIFGNSRHEAMYPVYMTDDKKQALNGSTGRYIIHFKKDQLPPVNAFWSLTMYDQPASLLVHNPINRYLLNSTMLPEFTFDDDGGLTLHIQNESPGKDKEANWLPAPKGPFSMVMRLYWPKAEAVDGKWKQPPLMRVK